MKLRLGWVWIVCFCLSLPGLGQNAATSSATVSVPPIIQFSNVATDEGGTPMTGSVSISFSLYNSAVGGQALWTETQNVQLGSAGQYSVYLGLTQTNGLPANLFTSGQAQWLGVKISGQPEQPRVFLVSVPYAMKAGDAATIGGLPPSAFVMAAPGSTAVASSDASTAGGSSLSPNGAITGSGTVGYIPLWDTTSDIISSVLFQSGSGSTAKVGINNATPAATLDVKGTANLRGTTTVLGMLSLPATGAATAAAGKNSEPITHVASAYNSSTSAAVNQTFEWLAEPANNDTSTPSGTLNLLFGQGTAKPAETGLHIAANGQITFVAGQTFPGTGSGTVTSVATSSGLTGGPITSSGTLQIDPTVVPELGAASNTFSGSITASGFTGSGSGLTNVNAATLNGLPSSAFAPAGTYATLGANTFAGTQTVSTGDLALSTGNLDLSGTGAINLGGSAFAFGIPYSSGNGSNSGGSAFLGFAGNPFSTGSFDTAVGKFALDSNSTGQNNVAVGYSSLLQNTTGSSNTAVGATAGITADNSAMTGSNNTFLGSNAMASTGTWSNATAIGFTAEVAESNALVLGGTGTNAVDVGIGTTKPLARLTISGSETTANGSGAGIQLTNTASGGMDYYFRVGATGTNTGAGNMSIANDDEYIMTFTPPGNVGILNPSPSYTLDVYGTGHFTSAVTFGSPVTFASGQTFPSTISGVTAGAGLSGGGTSGNVTLSLASNGCSPGYAITALPTVCSPFASLGMNTFTGSQTVGGNLIETANIGIGTASPAGPLHVNGPYSAPASGQASGNNGLLLGTDGDTSYKWVQSYGGPLALNPEGNNVGIGTSTPNASLAVNGSFSLGGDTPMSHNPRMTFSSFLPGNLGNDPIGGVFMNDVAITITRLTATSNSPGGGCSQYASLQVSGWNTDSVYFTLYLNLFDGEDLSDSGAISVSIPAGAGVYIASTGASGCGVTGQSPSDVNVTMQYVMN